MVDLDGMRYRRVERDRGLPHATPHPGQARPLLCLTGRCRWAEWAAHILTASNENSMGTDLRSLGGSRHNPSSPRIMMENFALIAKSNSWTKRMLSPADDR